MALKCTACKDTYTAEHMEEVLQGMKDELSKQYHITWCTLKDYVKKSFWSKLSANIAMLLVISPYIVK
jgi:hypothetical protein